MQNDLIPEGWEVIGAPPPPVESAEAVTAEVLEALTEDILQIRTPDSRFVVDLGWYPEGSRRGAFNCRLVIDENWRTPTQMYRTASSQRAVTWIRLALRYAISHGAPGFPPAISASARPSVAPCARHLVEVTFRGFSSGTIEHEELIAA